MATKIVTKNSSTASAVPTASDLVQGELAVNVVDKRLFTENNAGAIVELGTNPSTIDINAGTIDGAVIGGTTPVAITGSTVTSTGNIVVTGTVDGRDVATDGTKLDGIEAGATADQTAAEIKTAYESNADTNAFTDADHTKLDGIEAGADVTDTTNVTAAGALMDSEVTNLAQVKAFDSADYATAAQGTKVDGIEAGADVTDTANVTAAGALMDSELTSEASVKALNQGVATTDSPAFAGLTVDTTTLAVDSTNNRVGIGIASPAVQLHVQNSAPTSEVLRLGSSTVTHDTGIYMRSTGTSKISWGSGGNLAFYGGGAGTTERMRIDSSGNVGIGTTTPDQALTVSGNIQIQNDDGYLQFKDINGGTNNKFRRIYNQEQNLYISRRNDDESLEANDVVIDSFGSIGLRATANVVNTTSGAGMWVSNGNYVAMSREGTNAANPPLYLNQTGIDGQVLAFRREGITRGNVSITASAVTYNTNSDYRLKTDVQPMTGATDRLKVLKPVNFEWITDGTRVDGFLAHEAQAVVPECVTGEKDAMMEEEYEVTPAVLDEEGNTVEEAVMGTRSVPHYQGIDQSKLVPLLVATIQELEARITQLENN